MSGLTAMTIFTIYLLFDLSPPFLWIVLLPHFWPISIPLMLIFSKKIEKKLELKRRIKDEIRLIE